MWGTGPHPCPVPGAAGASGPAQVPRRSATTGLPAAAWARRPAGRTTGWRWPARLPARSPAGSDTRRRRDRRRNLRTARIAAAATVARWPGTAAGSSRRTGTRSGSLRATPTRAAGLRRPRPGRGRTAPASARRRACFLQRSRPPDGTWSQGHLGGRPPDPWRRRASVPARTPGARAAPPPASACRGRGRRPRSGRSRTPRSAATRETC